MARGLSVDERETYLARPLIGVLSVTAEAERAPLTTPIWYDYRPGGDVVILTSPRSRKGRLIAAAGRYALCAQDGRPPYTYVTAEGPVVETRAVTEGDRRAMAARYLGEEIAKQYVALTYDAQHTNVAFVMRPDRWNTSTFDDVGARISG